jgi:hypothetical protein
MADLELQVRAPQLQHPLRSGARVEVLPVEASSSEERRAVHGELVDILPEGADATGSHRVFGLQPGRYLVRAELPSGVVLEQAVVLRADEPTHVVLRAGSAKNAWAAYAQLTGALAPGRASDLGFAGLESVESSGAEAGEEGPLHARVHVSCTSLVPDPGTWAAVLEAPPWVGTDAGWQRTDRDGETEKWVRMGPAQPGLEALLVERPRNTWLLVAPRGWPTTEPPVLEMTVGPEDDGVAGSGPALGVRDPYLGSAMAWMRRGNVATAANSLRSVAMGMLEGKLENPYAAAMGAHLLCETENLLEGSLARWISNLDEWFDWLPDGTIVRAYLATYRARSREELAQAVRIAHRAFDRGIPLYTHGLQRLRDVLLMLREHVQSSRNDASLQEQHQARLRAVTTVLSRMRPDRVFTTIRLPRTGR